MKRFGKKPGSHLLQFAPSGVFRRHRGGIHWSISSERVNPFGHPDYTFRHSSIERSIKSRTNSSGPILLAVPSGHGIHLKLSSEAINPAGHRRHEDMPRSGAMRPSKHCSQGSPFELTVPGSQAAHLPLTSMLPGEQTQPLGDPAIPAGHRVHFVAFGARATLFGGHVSQRPVLGFTRWSFWHLTQAPSSVSIASTGQGPLLRLHTVAPTPSDVKPGPHRSHAPKRNSCIVPVGHGVH